MALTPAEMDMLDAEMGKLAPGFRMFRPKEFAGAVRRAAAAFPEEKQLALLMRRVLTDKRCDGYGVPFAHWWIAFEMRLLEGIQQDPWSEAKWWLWESMRGKRQILTLWGSQNSLKSSFVGRFSVVQMAVWLQHAEVYIAGPYKAHADDKIWKALSDWIRRLGQVPNKFVQELNLQFTAQAEECFITDRATGERGMAKFVSLESASAIQGKKSAGHDPSGLVGIMVLAVDEFIENPNLEINQGQGNVGSNANFFGILPCNPLPEHVQHPNVMRFSEPALIPVASMDRQRDFRWETRYGICARFSWLNCPNNLLGRTEWHYMLNSDQIKRLKDQGDEAMMMAQGIAWGFGSGARNAPLDQAAIRMAGTMKRHIEDFTWNGTTQLLVHIDCAFGGRDPATATILEAGEATITNTTAGNNYPVTKKVFSGVEQRTMIVDPDFIATEEWIERMNMLFEHTGGGFPHTVGTQPVQPGDRMGGNWHLCGLVLELLYELDIPPTHCSFDASQRGDCVAPMLDCLGRSNVRWWYEGSRKIVDEEMLPPAEWFKWPYEYEDVKDTGEQVPVKWSGYCSQTISMIWFSACNVIRHGFLVGGDAVKLGLEELCARPVVRGRQGQTEGRRDVMGKDKLKDMGQQSPTWGEGLATAIYFGIRFCGLVPIEGPKLSTSVSMTVTPMSIIRAPGMNRRFGAPADSRVELEAAMASMKQPPYKPLTTAQVAMNSLVLTNARR